MKLYIGGVYQGQRELAAHENPDALLFTDFHETVRQALARQEDPRRLAEKLYDRHPDAVVVCDEIGAGIVPLRAEDRAWREGVGRALCVLAQHAQCVTRVVCGIGVRIK